MSAGTTREEKGSKGREGPVSLPDADIGKLMN
jgi:hypothetical protein